MSAIPRAEDASGLLLVAALRLHQRDQFAGDERKGNEKSGDHDAGDGEDDSDIVGLQERPEPAVLAENETKISPATTGETENGRSISDMSSVLPRNSNLVRHHAAATPKTVLSGTAISATHSVRRILASVSGSTIARR